ncbi:MULTISPECIES: preprotein translocase subunit YajC [unclassified Isoptericola]|uniref:preprotein translocase subunit YajC n=1 Tax=unclassified Isoptericola TaxID=2623355 RepID=UPI0027125737|nr:MULTISPECIES: preprotein translocase subunit YajC [unclassified Isoptericola]MDO8145070.1 preprotein translocase subunit YajC [Isoptericola sp. 178]MDO8148704.1 preprotein translocase subunit YajC [Isoptericola sp. b515]MDO8151350.1 preprotein translocase subunit YajC [Isoptericola sp. b408]
MDPTIIILFVALAALMLFMSSRTRKQQKQQAEFRSSLAPGQEVMTGSGLVGTVVDIDEESDIVTLESTPGSQTRWLRAAVVKRMDQPVADSEDDEVTEDTSEAGSIAPADGPVEVPDDLSELDTAERKVQEDKRREHGETEDK